MGALPSSAPGGRIPARCGGLTANQLPGWGRRGLASGMGSVETVVQEDEITSVDALKVSSCGKSTMDTCCTHQRKFPLWVAYTPIDGLQTEACGYVFQLWRLGHTTSSLRGAISAMRALEEMGWLPEFVTGRVWRCAKWATSQAVARPYVFWEELRSFARACDGKEQWMVYGTAVL